LVFPRPGADYIAPGKKNTLTKLKTDHLATMENYAKRSYYARPEFMSQRVSLETDHLRPYAEVKRNVTFVL
jgi:hypothetical protein